MAVSNVSNVNSTDNQSTSSLAATSAKELSDRFLTMLTAQMRNQDPLNPLDNAQLTSQMAQISTVTGISQLNTTMQWLGYSMGSLQATQATSLIGRQVLATGNTLTLDEGKGTVGYNVAADADKATLQVYDKDKNVVATLPLEGKTVGTHTFEWDGKTADGKKVADGAYTFDVMLEQSDKSAKAATLDVKEIAAVRPSSNGTVVLDSKGASINLADVYQVW
jgi:flagellar basal-body rod modification protein FlgD